MVNISNFTKEVDLKSSGVYLISHSNTDIKYVGSTKNTFSSRWKSHLNGLKRGIGNPVLLNIYNKYGIEGFSFKILEKCSPENIHYIRERERYWIEYYDSYKHGANCTLETECAFISFKRHPYTEEDKLKYMLTSPTKKKVYLYDGQGNLLYIFPSTVACDRFLGLPKRRTNWAINHLLALKKIYFPSYENKVWNPLQERYERKCKIMKAIAKRRKEEGTFITTEDTKKLIRKNNPVRKECALYDIEGNYIRTFLSLNECDDYLNLTRGSTSKFFKGKVKLLKRKYIPKLI